MIARPLMAIFIYSLPITSIQAAIIDQPYFKIGGMVVVWGGGNKGSFAVEPTSDSQNLQNSNALPVITGILQSQTNDHMSIDSITLGMLDETDSFTDFSKDSLQSSFYVASNTAFTIRAELAKDEHIDHSLLKNIHRSLEVNRSGQYAGGAFGGSAQFPHSNDSPQAGVINDGYLSNLVSEKIVFVGNQKTAKSQGNVVDQSVRFTNTYKLVNMKNIDIKAAGTLAASVIYTVAIP